MILEMTGSLVMSTGEHYERRAAGLLEKAGLVVLERNFRCKTGEIDIICSDGPSLVFVEVRYRQNPRFASAAASVTRAKQRKLIRTAQFYLQRRGWLNHRPCRFDVVAFSSARDQRADGIQWLKSAFTM
jgi:putative endonuclease